MLQPLILCLYLFLHVMRCLHLLLQATSLTWIIVSGSSSSKLSSSRLILLRSVVLWPISSLKNATISESISSRSISSLENTALSCFSSIYYKRIRNKFYCWKTSINSFITHFLSFQDTFKISWLRQIYSLWSYSFRRRLNDIFKTSWQTIIFVFIIRLQDVFKTFPRRLQDKYIGLNQDVLKSSWRRLLKKKTKDVFYLLDVFNMSLRLQRQLTTERFP